MKKIIKFILDWVWQLPQNLIGIIYKSLIKEDIILTNTNDNFILSLTKKGGGVTLGKYVFVNQNYTDITKVIKHESGHVKQSLYLGPLYLPVIGLRSLIHASLHSTICKTKDYYHYWTEKWANKLGGVK